MTEGEQIKEDVCERYAFLVLGIRFAEYVRLPLC